MIHAYQVAFLQWLPPYPSITATFPFLGVNNFLTACYMFTASAEQLNMKGVFLHVLGDALGSVVVIISAVIYMTVPKMCDGNMISVAATTAAPNATTTVIMENVTEMVCDSDLVVPQWVQYVDPILRLAIVCNCCTLLYTSVYL